MRLIKHSQATLTARPFKPNRQQRGIVLLIALIMLVVVSLLVVNSVRNAGSTEAVVGNVRTTELATQAAEVALRHCEASLLARLSATSATPSTYLTTFNDTDIQSSAIPPHWQSLANWDVSPPAAYIVPLALVNQAGMATTTYKRPPECMVERLPVPPIAAGAVASASSSFVVTARGFGPEVVAADASRSRPLGSEVWMQSQIDIQ